MKKDNFPVLPSWDEQLIDMADTYLTIIHCKDCGGAVNKGYCCVWCGSSEPR